MTVTRRFTNAQFWVGPGEEDFATELLVHDGVIVGLNTAIADRSEPDDAVENINLGGAYVYPAFRDGHCHPLFAGREMLGVNITTANSIAEIQTRLREHIQANTSELWVDAAAYDRGLIASVDCPRLLLDEVSTEHAIVLHAEDHHTLWVNTKALELAGIALNAPELPEGEVSTAADLMPNGVLREWPAMRLVLDLMPAPNPSTDETAWSQAQNRLIAAGIVEVQDAWIDPGMATSYKRLAETGRLAINCHLAIRLDPVTWKSDWDEFMREKAEIDLLGSPRLKVNSAKIFIDGAFGNRTAAVSEPYDDGSVGKLNWPQEQLLVAIRGADEAGLQCHFHAIGDAAVAAVCDALEVTRPRLRSVVAHAELIGEVELARLRSLGVTLQLQPLWARRDSMLNSCATALGEARVERLYPFSTALRGGIQVAFGSDWPVSNPEPLAGIAVAATRLLAEDSTKPALNAAESISVADAWRAYSHGVAQQLGGEKRGLLAVGHSADFLTLPLNVFEAAPLSLGDLKVGAVYLAGNHL